MNCVHCFYFLAVINVIYDQCCAAIEKKKYTKLTTKYTINILTFASKSGRPFLSSLPFRL